MVNKNRDIIIAKGQSICVFLSLLHGKHGKRLLRCGGTSNRSCWHRCAGLKTCWNLPWSSSNNWWTPLTSWLREISSSWTMDLGSIKRMIKHSSSSLTIIGHIVSSSALFTVGWWIFVGIGAIIGQALITIDPGWLSIGEPYDVIAYNGRGSSGENRYITAVMVWSLFPLGL